MHADPPPALHVDADLDGVRVTLGPARTPLLRPGATAILAVGLLGAGIAVGFGSVGGAIAIGASAQLLALWQRVRRWRRHEAPLRLTIAPGEVRLTRTFRRSVLHERALALSDLHGCTALPDGLRFDTARGPLHVRTHFRSFEELRWTASTVEEALHEHAASGRGVPDTAALSALDDVRAARRR